MTETTARNREETVANPRQGGVPMTEACGCETREGHVDPSIDPVLHIEHGERDELNGDPLPHAVPGTGGWNGLYTASPDAFCLCGHPNYLTCEAWPMGGQS